LPGRSREEGRDGSEPLPMPIRDKQIHVRSTTRKRTETHVPRDLPERCFTNVKADILFSVLRTG
jgi:hypothetical protein